MKALPLVRLRDGKHILRWPVLLARFAVYFVIFGLLVAAVTWIFDRLSKTHDLDNLVRLVTIPGFLAVFFLVHDLRRDLKRSPKELSDADCGTDSKGG
jgi:ABC-type Na+ efflux pump permease subunit